MSIIDVYNPISDIENIQFIIYIWGEGTRLPIEARQAYSLPQKLEICERSEQNFHIYIYIWGEGIRMPSKARNTNSLPQELEICERSEQTF